MVLYFDVCISLGYRRRFGCSYRYTYAPPSYRTDNSTAGLIISKWNDLADPVFDGVRLAGFESRSHASLWAQAARYLCVFHGVLFLFLLSLAWFCWAGFLGPQASQNVHNYTTSSLWSMAALECVSKLIEYWLNISVYFLNIIDNVESSTYRLYFYIHNFQMSNLCRTFTQITEFLFVFSFQTVTPMTEN